VSGLRAASYAVVDVETTGLAPATDRIVELAIVRLDATGESRASTPPWCAPTRR
jgi:DNA polymerase III epsilon subunit-like protein